MTDKLTTYFMKEFSINENEAQYIINNPCLEGPQEKCDAYKETGCAGCTSLNGFVLIKTSEKEKPKPTAFFLDTLKDKKTLVLVEKDDSGKE